MGKKRAEQHRATRATHGLSSHCTQYAGELGKAHDAILINLSRDLHNLHEPGTVSHVHRTDLLKSGMFSIHSVSITSKQGPGDVQIHGK